MRILHISDLHERGPGDALSWRTRRVLGPAWESNIDRLCAEAPIDFVCFTGDAANTGRDAEYGRAAEFLSHTLRRLNLSDERLFVVSGNHDIDRQIEASTWRKFRQHALRRRYELSRWMAGGATPDGFSEAEREALLSRGAAYRRWVSGVLGRPALLPERSPHGRLGYRASFRLPGHSFDVHIIGLDSAWLSGDDADHGNLLLTEDQIGILSADARGDPLEGVRIALVHHPLESLADVSACRRLLADRVDLLLRGHLHEADPTVWADADRTLHEVAAGCLYEGQERDEYRNGCNVLTLHLDDHGRLRDCDVWFRAWSARGHWHDDDSASRRSIGGRLHLRRLESGTQTPNQAPVLPPHFLPRAEALRELERLVTAPAASDGALRVTSIVGMAGLGKSTLAAALAHHLARTQTFEDGIFWVTLGQQPATLSLLAGLIQSLGDFQYRALTVENTAAHLRRLMRDRHVLLVVDDAWELPHVAPFFATGPNGHVLLTTRDASLATTAGGRRYEPRFLTTAESVSLLERHLGATFDQATRDDVLAFAETVGYLPLALELGAAQVADGLSWKELLDDLRGEIARLESLERPDAQHVPEPARKRLSVRASLLLSVRRLPDATRRRFAWLGVLPEDATIGGAMARTLWDCDEPTAAQQLRYLWHKSLLQQVGARAYRLHDLVHDQARRLLVGWDAETLGLPGLAIPLPDAHAAFLQRYRPNTTDGRWSSLPADAYIHERLVWHLERAGWTDELHVLLREERDGRNGWYAAREALMQVGGFVEDVAAAWRNAENPEIPLSRGQRVAAQTRYALMLSSLYSSFQHVPAALLTVLVQQGVWTVEKAKSFASQLGTQREREELERALEIIGSDLAVVRSISGQDRVGALAALALRLPPSFRLSFFVEAVDAARQIEDESVRGQALAALAPHLPAPLIDRALLMLGETAAARQTLLGYLLEGSGEPVPAEEARQTVKECVDLARGCGGFIVVENERDRLPGLTRTAGSVHADTLDDVASLVGSGNPDEDLLLMRAFARFFAPVQSVKALWTFRDFDGDELEAFDHLAPHFGEAAGEAIRHIAERVTDARAVAIAHLAPYLAPTQLEAVFEIARRIGDESDRNDALENLAVACFEAGAADAALSLMDRLEPGYRGRALSRITPLLHEERYVDTVFERALQLDFWAGGTTLVALADRVSRWARAAVVKRLAAYVDDRALSYRNENDAVNYGEGDHKRLQYLEEDLLHWAGVLARFDPDRAQAILGSVALQMPSTAATSAAAGVPAPAHSYEEYCAFLRPLANGPRKTLLRHVASESRTIAEVGGAEAIAETFRAVLDVTSWWH